MKLSKFFILFILFIVLFFINLYGKNEWPVLKGPYLGQKPPGMTATIFAPGILSTGNIEKCIAFMPDGRECFFAVLGDSTCFIASIKRENDRWRMPQVVSFTGKYEDMEFSLSPDALKLYFTSNRPIPGRENQNDYNIWVVSRKGQEWGIPHSLGPDINTDAYEISPSVTIDGTVYFYRREENSTDWNIYCYRPKGGKNLKLEKLSPPVNSKNREFDPYIAPDESFLIFCAVNREDSMGGSDLYICFHRKDGTWSKAINLGEKINSPRWEFCPYVTVDGKFLFFASNRRFTPEYTGPATTFTEKIEMLNNELMSAGNGHSDYYWVDAKIIEKLKPKNLK